MKRIISMSLVALSVTALTGCPLNDKEIDKVKELIYEDIDSTNTLGNALDTRKMCKNAKWVSTKDERKRDVVVYSCELTGFEVYFNKYTEERISSIRYKSSSELDEAERKYNNAVDTNKEDKEFIALVNKLRNKNIFSVFAQVTTKTKGIYDIIRFVTSEGSDKRIIRYHLSDELVEQFIKAATDFNTVIDNTDLYSAIMSGRYKNVFGAIVEYIAEDGLSEDEAIKKATQYYDGSDTSDLERAKTEYETLKNQISESGLNEVRKTLENNQPIKVVHNLTYAVAGITPVLLGCEFDFYTPNSKDNIAYKKRITNGKQCLTESYATEYDNFYIRLFGEIYTESLKRK